MIGPRASALRNRELWLPERAAHGEMSSSFDINIKYVTFKVSQSWVIRSLLTSPGRHRHIVPLGTMVRAELLRIRISNSDRPAHFVIAGLTRQSISFARMLSRKTDGSPDHPRSGRGQASGDDACLCIHLSVNKHDFAISRPDMPEVCQRFPYPPFRGRREYRAPDAPDSRVCNEGVRAHTR